MKSSIFLNYITVIDHSYIGSDGRQHGGSFHASFDVSGEVVGDEAVVIDFSTVKKSIKAIVDHNDTGFDHKLWFISGFSKGFANVDRGVVNVVTPAVEITAPADIIRYMNCGSYDTTAIAALIGKEVKNALAYQFPGIGIDVVCRLSEEPWVNVRDGRHQMFRYSHGLSHSTSYGCQNIAHGHLSWIEFGHDANYRDDCADCKQNLEKMRNLVVNKLDGAVLINAANIVGDDDDSLTIAYESGRGKFWAKYLKNHSKYVVMPHETTIEHIVDWFVTEYGFYLEGAHVNKVFISEGLAKGSSKECGNG